MTYLFIRRVIIPQVKYISLPADYFPLFLLLAIGITGVLMRYLIKVDLLKVKELALSLQVDGTSVNLTPPGGRYRNIPCLVHSDDCAPYGVEAEIDPPLLKSLLEAHTIEGLVLGFTVRLTKDDQAAIEEFAARTRLLLP